MHLNKLYDSMTQRRNLETYSVVIFCQDLAVVNQFQIHLKELIYYIVLFEVEDDVINYIRENAHDLIILILCTDTSERVIKCTHDLKQLYQIYVYNPTNAKRNNQESFLKFDRYTTVIWYLQFIQLLINLQKKNDDRQALFDYLKEYYDDDHPVDRKAIFEFEHEYSPSQAIEWYTRDSFVYRILNKAFRSFNVETLVLFRFFIVDLYEQLHSLYDGDNTSRETIYYRGQRMQRKEVEALKKDQRICSTSFLSATRDPDLAIMYAGVSDTGFSSDGLYPVVFNIRPFYFNYKQSVLADVKEFSHFGDGEEEILFAVGTCFRIAHIQFDDKRVVWFIDLEEDYVQDKIGMSNRPFHRDMITMGFYLLVRNDDFQSVQMFYEVLLKQANSFLWIASCRVGLGLIEYWKKNYLRALEQFEQAFKIINEEDPEKGHGMMGNLLCILANVHRELENYSNALDLYQKAVRIIGSTYFIEPDRCFCEMFIFFDSLNPFVKDDKYFYYCDRPDLNRVLLYRRTEQWHLAREVFQQILDDYSECKRNGEIEMLVKILGDGSENSSAEDLMEKNRAFLDDRTLTIWSGESYQRFVLYAYEELARHYLEHQCSDRAYLCYQEILRGGEEIDSLSKFQSFEGLGRVYEMKEEYIKAIEWFQKVIDLDLNGSHLSTLSSPTIRSFQKILSIFNEKLNDPISPVIYLKEISNTLMKRTNHRDVASDLIVTMYKITIQFYHHNDKAKIEFVCDHIQGVLDRIRIDDQQWRQWLCVGSLCNMEEFKVNYHHRCVPILDENYNFYLRVYHRIHGVLSSDTTDRYKTELRQCERFIRSLTGVKLERVCQVFQRWKSTNAPMNDHLNLTRSMSDSPFFMPTM